MGFFGQTGSCRRALQVRKCHFYAERIRGTFLEFGKWAVYVVLLIFIFCISVEMTSEKESPSHDYPSYDHDSEQEDWDMHDTPTQLSREETIQILKDIDVILFFILLIVLI